MILHRSRPILRLESVRGGLATIVLPDRSWRIVPAHTLHGSRGGQIEVGMEVNRIRQAEAAGRWQRRAAV
jgi:hypothetical protein